MASAEMSPHPVLIIDDDAEVASFIATVAETTGLAAVVAEHHERFEEYYRECDPSVVVTDLQMPGVDGVEVLRFLAGARSGARVVLLSGVDTRVISTARRLGESLGLDIVGALTKPVKVAELQALLRGPGASAREIDEVELGAAVSARQLRLHYQPKVCVTGPEAGEVVGMEALVRWQHPRLGLLGPGMFIGLAERSGVIVALTETVLDMAIEQAARWRAQGLDLSVAVNLSTQLLASLDLPDRIARRVAEARVPAEKLILETTETGAMDDTAGVMDVLTRLRLKGFELSIDDFGTGYSSLVQLYRMPFSELKIDKSFVMALGENQEAEVIVRSVVDLAHNLSMSVCAEGVENEQAWRLLQSLGCDRAQGYYMSRPLPPEEMPQWLAQWRALGVPDESGASRGRM